MKENFNLSFKKISKRKVDNNKRSSFRKILIAALVQSKLDMLYIELIYIYEFSVNERNFNNYGWWEKSKQGYVDYLMDNFSMTFIWAFSEQRFYGIMGNKKSNNSSSFIEFATKIFASRSKSKTTIDLKPIIICYNASIHKSRDWFKFHKDSGISILIIPHMNLH